MIDEEEEGEEEGGEEGEEDKDTWGRKYEKSQYQWLPCYFDIDHRGCVTIPDYINNLVPRAQHEPLYSSLASLFAHALPLVEAVYSYGRVVRTELEKEVNS